MPLNLYQSTRPPAGIVSPGLNPSFGAMKRTNSAEGGRNATAPYTLTAPGPGNSNAKTRKRYCGQKQRPSPAPGKLRDDALAIPAPPPQRHWFPRLLRNPDKPQSSVLSGHS